MSFWSSVSFNFAILINLLVAFFYPFGSNIGGMSVLFDQTTVVAKQNSVFHMRYCSFICDIIL